MNPITGGALIEAGGGLVSSAANLWQANRQMKFQERMSSTAYQRAAADMKAAGLNPMMMYSKGGGPASTPQGASADVDNVAKGAGAAGAAIAQNKLAQQAMTNATRQTDAQVTLLQAEADLARARAATEAGRPGELAQSIQESMARIQKMAADRLATEYGYKEQYWRGESAQADYYRDKTMGAIWERVAGTVLKTFQAWDKITPPTAGDILRWSLGGEGGRGDVDAFLKRMAGDKTFTEWLQKTWNDFKTTLRDAPSTNARDLGNKELR